MYMCVCLHSFPGSFNRGSSPAIYPNYFSSVSTHMRYNPECVF